MPTVLLIEDDPRLSDVIARALHEDGLGVITARDARTGLARAGSDTSAIVLDIGLPDADGRDLCMALRARGILVPVLFLTARDAVHERLLGFAAGADDYLTKPFHTAELLARLRVLMRSEPAQARSVSGLLLDPIQHAVTFGGNSVSLSPTEFRLLAALLAHPHEVVRRHALVRAGWPNGAIVHQNTLDQYIARIRRKLAQIGTFDQLQTVRGVGYRIVRQAVPSHLPSR